jgi:hypothetical protein
MLKIRKEAILSKQIIVSMGIKRNLPFVLRYYNVGAMYLEKNHSTCQRTNHIDNQTHFFIQFIEDDILKVIFVRNGYNDSETFTKNLGVELQLKLSKKIIMDVDSNILRPKDVKITWKPYIKSITVIDLLSI